MAFHLVQNEHRSANIAQHTVLYNVCSWPHLLWPHIFANLLLLCSIPATLGSWVFLQYMRYSLASEPLYLLSHIPGMLFSAWLSPSKPSSPCSTVTSHTYTFSPKVKEGSVNPEKILNHQTWQNYGCPFLQTLLVGSIPGTTPPPPRDFPCTLLWNHFIRSINVIKEKAKPGKRPLTHKNKASNKENTNGCQFCLKSEMEE